MTLIRILLGGLIPLAVAYSIGKLCFRDLPDTIALGLGAVIESLIVFGFLAAGAARPPLFLALAVAGLAPLISRRTRFRAPGPRGLLPICIFAGYAAFYLIHALAPEIQPDAAFYHLGFVAGYARTGGFPNRVTFYETLPQGMEMLFLFAFTIGKHSAAKLVDFGFLLATVPLMMELGRRLQLPDRVSGAAAVLYFCSPIVGITGTSAYTDATLVFFTLAALVVLLIWKKEHNDRYLIAAGLLAGFCYCIKVSCLLVPVLAVAFVASERRLRPILAVTAAAMVAVGPWMIRDVLVTGSPLAPLANSFFPTQYFHLPMERSLVAYWWHYPGFSWRTAWRELTVGGKLQGNFGPIWILLPVGLLALRRSVGRWIWLAALLLAYAWILNVGARFLMMSLPFLAFALAMSLDSLARPVLWACLVVHAVTCEPTVALKYQSPDAWILKPLPWRAALRLESEHDYLTRNIWAYRLLDFLREKTGATETTFALVALPNAYYERPVVDFWESALADRVMDAFAVPNWRFAARAQWPAQLLKGLRFRMTAAHPGEWDLADIRLYSDTSRAYYSPKWLLRAWPNPWEAPLAFDDNLATRWRTWEPIRRGMLFEVSFDHPRQLTAAELTTHAPTNEAPIEVYGQGINGAWKLLSGNPVSSIQTPEDLHRAAMVYLKQSGIDYILAPTQSAGVWQTGKILAEHAREWGLEDVGQCGEVHLLRIPAQLSMIGLEKAEPGRTAPAEALSIRSLDPPATDPKVGFHMQPNGESAISITGSGFEHGSVVTANGYPLETTFGSPEWLTALLPGKFYQEPGTIEFKVVNPDKKISNGIKFQVGDPAWKK